MRRLGGLRIRANDSLRMIPDRKARTGAMARHCVSDLPKAVKENDQSKFENLCRELGLDSQHV